MALTLRDATDDDLLWVERSVRRCARAMAAFGGFYGAATTKLAPLLGPARSLLVVLEDGLHVGFVDVDHDPQGYVCLSYFVVGHARGRGVAREALLLVAQRHPDQVLKVAVNPHNLGGLATAQAAGFVVTGINEWDETVLCRTPR